MPRVATQLTVLASIAVSSLAVCACSGDSDNAPEDPQRAVVASDPGHNAVPVPVDPSKYFADITSWAGLNILLPGQGIAFADVDGDGFDDVIAPGEQRSYVLRNRGDGSFYPFVLLEHPAAVGLFPYAVDLTEDGLLDILLVADARPILFEGFPNGGFLAKEGLLPPGDPRDIQSVASFGDYDGDGRQDLYLGRMAVWEGSGDQIMDPESDECRTADELRGQIIEGTPGPDQLLLRDGAGFRDATQGSGLDIGLFTQAVATLDLNGDGNLDILVGTEGFRTDAAFLGDGHGHFKEQGVAAGMDHVTSAMGYDAVDFDADGDLDLYVADEQRNDGDKFYRQQPDGTFRLVPPSELGLALTDERTGWGVGLVDLDLDGDLDLFEATGLPLLGCPGGEQENLLFLNEGGIFKSVSPPDGSALEALWNSRTAAFSDIDGDGDLDILVSNINGPPTLMRNDMGAGRHWLKVKLVHPTLRPPVGSRVTLTWQGQAQRRDLHGTASYGGSSSEWLHFGLGDATEVTDLTVRWPDGKIQIVGAVSADQSLVVTYP